MARGLFINFESIDGGGKDTQIPLLSERLQNLGHQLFIGVEPTYNFPAGQRIRQILAHKLPAPEPAKMQYLYYEDRVAHVHTMLEPILAAGAIVLENRYMFSTMAYGIAFGVDYDLIRQWHSDMPLPDINFYLKVSPAVAIERLTKKGKLEYFEKLESLTRISESYDQLWQRTEWKDSVVIINGEQTIEKIHEEIWSHIQAKLVA
ncbi:MAG: dTMP kinase [Candidatus Komeilibacteria bacterium]